MILASNSSYSQRIRTIGTDTFVTFTREQAKAINDTFISQRNNIVDLKLQDSINNTLITQLNTQDSIRQVRDSITYYTQILPMLFEIKRLLNEQVETKFKTNIEIGVGGGLSTYFGAYRGFAYNSIVNGKYYIPSANIHAKVNLTKHFTTRFEHSITETAYSPKFKDINNSTVLFDYNIAPNYYSIRVGMIPTISIGFNMFGLENKSPVIGTGIKSYFTNNTSLEINVRYIKTNIDDIGDPDHFTWGHITITRKIK